MRRIFEIRTVRMSAMLFGGFGLLTLAGFAVLIGALHLPAMVWYVVPAVEVALAMVFFGLVVPISRPTTTPDRITAAGWRWTSCW
jgi:hypothetical protein